MPERAPPSKLIAIWHQGRAPISTSLRVRPFTTRRKLPQLILLVGWDEYIKVIPEEERGDLIKAF